MLAKIVLWSIRRAHGPAMRTACVKKHRRRDATSYKVKRLGTRQCLSQQPGEEYPSTTTPHTLPKLSAMAALREQIPASPGAIIDPHHIFT